MKFEQFRRSMEILAESCNYSGLTANKMAVFWEHLQNMETGRLEWTFQKAVQCCDRFPSIGKMVSISRDYPNPQRFKDKRSFGGKYVTLKEALNSEDPTFRHNDMLYNIRTEWDKLPDEIKSCFKNLGGN